MASGAMGVAVRELRDLFRSGSSVGLTDGQLLARYAASNDGPAFAALVARHGPLVLATCRAVLRHEHDVEDAFQATFLVLAKKAHSVRAGEALAGWLHRVAYRVAVRANIQSRRRHRYESEMPEMALTIPDPARPGPELELRAIVHEEVDRLPEGLRLPVVLCDLEGLSYQQAATHLNWTEPTLRHRLVKARQRLRDRLNRRGVTGAALSVAIGSSNASAAVPVAWSESAVAAATGGATSLAAGALAHAVVRSLLLARLKIVTAAALVMVGITTAGVVIGTSGPDDPKPTRNAPAATQKPPDPAKVKTAATTGIVTVRGRVVGPDGKAVSGATVRAFQTIRDDRPTPESTSGADGQFFLKLAAPTPRMTSILVNSLAQSTRVVASAPGFGLALTEASLKPGVSDMLTIRLMEDGPPIEGRIIDLEGRPVAGARVRVEHLWFVEGIDLSTHIEKNQKGTVRNIWNGLKQLPTMITTTTDPDGRFHLTGIGRDRIVEMLVSGPAIAATVLHAMSRNGPDAHCINRWPEPKPVVLHSRQFESAVPPVKPIVGVVRDKDTGRPIARMKLRATVYNEDSAVNLPVPGVEATTDTQGRYRLTGLTKGSSYRVFVEPGEGLPYIKATLLASANSPGFDPVTFDIVLKRGVLVRGRVTDKVTGRPVPGYVEAFTFYNPLVEEFPDQYDRPSPAYVDENGQYQTVAMPGRGIIACRSDMLLYRIGIGAAAISGYDSRRSAFETRPDSCYVDNFHVLAEVNLDPRRESAPVDLQVDPGRSLTLTVVDPEWKPIGGTMVTGIGEMLSAIEYPQESPTIEIRSLDPSKPRRVTITHAARKLVGAVYLKGDETGPVTVRLQPWGTITGRIIDDEGQPRGRIGLWSAGGSEPPAGHGILPGGNRGEGVWIGPDGRFRFEGLVPGLKYGASVMDGVIMLIGELSQDVTVAPGEVRDLGDLKVIPLKRDGQP